MSVLMEVLQEELDRLERHREIYESALNELPKGYISKKNIRGRESYYLQHRDGGKIVSRYISAEELPEIEEQVQRRKRLQASLRRVKEDQKKLRKVVQKSNFV